MVCRECCHARPPSALCSRLRIEAPSLLSNYVLITPQACTVHFIFSLGKIFRISVGGSEYIAQSHEPPGRRSSLVDCPFRIDLAEYCSQLMNSLRHIWTQSSPKFTSLPPSTFPCVRISKSEFVHQARLPELRDWHTLR
jgi:hypothetical protein